MKAFTISFWRAQWQDILTEWGMDLPAYARRQRARTELGDDVYRQRLALRYAVLSGFSLFMFMVSTFFLTSWLFIAVTLSTLALTAYFGICLLKIGDLYAPIVENTAMHQAWLSLSPTNPVVDLIEQPLVIDYWDALTHQ